MYLAAPMPNELSEAYEGRLALLNGIGVKSAFERRLTQEVEVQGARLRRLSRLNQLARFAGMPLQNYVKQHTLLPAIEFAVVGDRTFTGGDLEQPTQKGRRARASLTQRTEAYLCPQCVKEDLDHWHFSWYRRQHHLVGVDWCAVHGVVLHQITAEDPYSMPPDSRMALGQTKELPAPAQRLPKDGSLARYVEVINAVLDKDIPYGAAELNQLLAERATALGMRVSQKGRKPLFSDLVQQHFPAPWLNRVLPQMEQKVANQFLVGVDNVLKFRYFAYGAPTYAILMAILFPSVSDAYAHCSGTPQGILASEKSRAEVSCNDRLQSSKYLAVLEGFAKSISKLADATDADMAALRRRILHVGIDAKNAGAGEEKHFRILARFGNGEPLEDVCRSEDAQVHEIQEILRLTVNATLSRLQREYSPQNPLV